MKKAMFILSTVLLFGILSSCSTDELTVKKNWVFTITTVMTANPTNDLYPQTLTVTEEKTMTTAEADAYIKAGSTTTSMSMGTFTITTTTTITKAEKK
jgi:hypothetical protein